MILELVVTSTLLSLFNIYSSSTKEKEIKKLKSENEQLQQKYTKNFSKIEKVLKNSEARAEHFNTQLKQREEENQLLEDKLSEVHQRWDIISDSRITSIPNTKEEWNYAKEVVSQPITKTWEPKKLSQTKDSMLKNNHYEPSEEELNQDFSSMNDDEFDKIIDEDSSSSSNGGSNNSPAPQKKPKIKTPSM